MSDLGNLQFSFNCSISMLGKLLRDYDKILKKY